MRGKEPIYNRIAKSQIKDKAVFEIISNSSII